MKKFGYLIMIVVLFGSISISCEKENEVSTVAKTNISNSQNEIVYFFDAKPVQKEVFEKRNLEIPFAIVNKQDENGVKEITQMHAFSSQEKYFSFGDANGYCYREISEFADEVSKFAESRGIIAEFERSGLVPDYYYEFERKKYEELIGKCGRINAIESRYPTFLYLDCFGGDGVVMPLTLPFMPFNNNEVSAFDFIGVTGSITMWDKSFYRTLIFSFSGFGFTKRCLPLGADDRMSSGVTL